MEIQDQDPSRLSIAAQFDDLCRFNNSFVQFGAIEDQLLGLLRGQEEVRNKWLASLNEVKQCHSVIADLQAKNNSLETALKNCRFSFEKELKTNERLRNEKIAIKKKLDIIKECLTDDVSENNGQNGQSSRLISDRLMSALNLQQLNTLVEEDEDSDEEHSLSDLDYDKTEDDIDVSRRASNGKRRSSGVNRRRSEHNPEVKELNKKQRPNEDFDMINDEEIEVAKRNASPERVQRTLFKSQTKTNVSTPNRAVTASTPTLKRSGGISSTHLESNGTTEEVSRHYHGSKFENKNHVFQHKSSVRPGKCGPCGGQIRWFSQHFACSQCLLTCHIDCKSKAPVPCIPFVARNQGKGKRTLISDFVSSEKPMIPSLVFHCCNEIEKRGLGETGLYRVSGSDREIKQLKEMILNSKSGMPPLGSYDISVICGVLKEFLRSLDEPLVSRVLWRDFVRAAEVRDPEDRKTYLCQAISELPPANRDTLAFLIIHLQRVCESPACKMPRDNLAKVIGPTIVGHSMSNPPPVEAFNEIKKQIAVMSLLLETPTEYWSQLINREPTEDFASRRTSLGTKTFGGSVQTNGTLTPHKPIYGSISNSAKKQLFMKPLF